VTWDEYDVFVFALDGDRGPKDVDAASRPTKPYINADRGFGHAGYAAMSIAHKGAVAYCEWLSKKTGRRYRLPTEDEWEYACRAGSTGEFCCDPDDLEQYAWFANNADQMTHAVASKKANAFGLHDMHGNVVEWVTGNDGQPITRGGSYLDSAERLRCDARRAPSRLWNASDPQIPKSVWWLCDAGFVGFRVVCEDPPGEPSSAAGD
jgi:formylglycine-generating enzyme required for sulfatase activity